MVGELWAERDDDDRGGGCHVVRELVCNMLGEGLDQVRCSQLPEEGRLAPHGVVRCGVMRREHEQGPRPIAGPAQHRQERGRPALEWRPLHMDDVVPTGPDVGHETEEVDRALQRSNGQP